MGSGQRAGGPRLVRSAGLPGHVARLQRIRCDGRCASILRASLVDPAAETTNNHTQRCPRITNSWAGLLSKQHVNNARL